MNKKERLIKHLEKLKITDRIIALVIINTFDNTNECICLSGIKNIDRKIKYINSAYTDQLRLKSYSNIRIISLWSMEEKDFKFDVESIF